jgi:hypothetical protein
MPKCDICNSPLVFGGEIKKKVSDDKGYRILLLKCTNNEEHTNIMHNTYIPSKKGRKEKAEKKAK